MPKIEGIKTYITNGVNILFQILALTNIINVDVETQLTITGGLIAVAGIFQRLGTKKAEAAALEAASKASTVKPLTPPVHPTSAYRP